MELTPTAKSSFIAGMGLSVLGWATLSHLDAIAELFRITRWLDTSRVFNWINGHKVLTLLGTEFVNYGAHGVDNPNAVTFAGGATVVNAIAIWTFVPAMCKWFMKAATAIKVEL